MKARFRNSLLLAFAVTVAGAGCAGTAPRSGPVPPVPLAVRLQPEEVEQLALLMRMEDVRELDLALVERILGHDQPEMRGRAAVAAGRIRDRAATPLLLRATGDADVRVSARAAFALGELGDSSAAVVAQLGAMAAAAPAPVAAEAVAALGRLGVDAGRPVIEELLGRDALPPGVAEAALLAAWRVPRAASTRAAVQRWLDAPDAEARWRAAYALARIGGPGAVQALLPLLSDSDDRVRASAVRVMRAPLVDSAVVRSAALPALVAAARDTHPHVRINALRLLPGYREPARTGDVLLQLLDDPDPGVAVAAAQALGEAGERSATARLRAVALDVGRPDGLRTAALHSLVRVDALPAVDVANAWSDSARWILRYHASRALGATAWSTAAGTLQRLARDPHYLVAAEALGAIRAAADTVLDLRRTWIEGLGAAHPLVRAAAARGLGRHGAADLDVLLHSYDRARSDSVPDAALATVEALGRLAGVGVPVERPFFARFAAGGPPTDPRVHRAIIERIGPPPAAWPAPVSRVVPRPFDFYRDVAHRLLAPAIAGEDLPLVAIGTPHGDIVLELSPADAPLTVHNFLALVEAGYYRDTRWHRVVPNFVIQDGDPRGDGSGGPGWAIRDEINPLHYGRGTLGMALSGPDTGGSQFFITHSPQPHLDGGYTVFGRVVQGMDVVDRVVQEEPVTGFRRLR